MTGRFQRFQNRPIDDRRLLVVRMVCQNEYVFECCISDDQLATELNPLKENILDFLKKHATSNIKHKTLKHKKLLLALFFLVMHLMMSLCKVCMHQRSLSQGQMYGQTDISLNK